MFLRGLYVLGSIYWRLIKGRFNRLERPQKDEITCPPPYFSGLAWLESQDPEYVV